MNKKWKRFLKDNEHYCPHCPEEERDDTFITTQTLRNFLKELDEEKADSSNPHNLLEAGRTWSSVHSRTKVEETMQRWSFTDWQVVAEKYAPKLKVTPKLVRKVQTLLEKIILDSRRRNGTL